MSTIAFTFTARFAGLDLEIVTWAEELGRNVVRHTPSRGNGAQLSDRGRVPRVYTLTMRLTGTPDEVTAKRNALVVLASSGDTRVFEHPLDGIVRCRLESLSGGVGAGDVSYNATLIEDLAFTRRFAQTTDRTLASVQDIEITGDELLAALAPLLLEDNPPIATMVQRARTWPTRAQNDVAADVSAMRATVAPTVRALDRTAAAGAYQASVALEAFRGAYERYAQAVNVLRGATFTLDVAQPLPLVVVLTSLYGARTAETLLDEVARINDVTDAARLSVGQQLTLPVNA